MAKKIKADQARALGRHLSDVRQAKYGTLEACGEACGVHASQIWRFEQGDFRTLSPNVVKICNFLQIDPEAKSPETAETIAAKAVKIAQASPAKLRFIGLMLDALDGQFGDHS